MYKSIFVLAAFLATNLEAAIDSPVGKQIKSFQLQDYLGARHSLGEWKDKRAVVVVFLGTECPLAKLYGPRLAAMSTKYKSKGVQFVGINSNQQDTLAEIAHYARVHKIDFPVLKDPGNKVADRFGAIRTPEVFLLDDKQVVRYWGRIDDQYDVGGLARPDAKTNYLEKALDELLAGKPVSTPAKNSVGCHIGRYSRVKPRGDITYSKQISRILQENCVSCHRPGQIAPFSLTSYDEVVGWAETIREVIEDRRMPPWHANPKHGKFANDARMSDEEKRLVFQWIDNGLPQGNPAELPKPLKFDEGWQIPQPDLVVKMPRAFKVPAKGVVQYKYFSVDPGFKEDVWIRGAEGRPGNRSVVHHLLLFYVPPGQIGIRPGDPLFNVLASFAPGTPATVSPKGYGRRVPAGSKLVFQMHYTPNGSEQLDLSEAGLLFADPKTIKKELRVGCAVNLGFRIPPGDSNHRVEARHKFGEDTLLYGLTPHMHLRGKSFRYTAIYPDKREEILLDVPQYDFNWQNLYRLAKPKLLPAGTMLVCVAHFDNSEENLVNPDPTKAVTWGDQTWEEMMVGSFFTSRAHQDLTVGSPSIRPIGKDGYELSFRFRPEKKVEAVYLAGNFNEWKPTGHKMDGPDKDGFFTTTVKLPAGRYEYKFVLDGKHWRPDPGNREQAGFYHNSVALVGGKIKQAKPKNKPKAKPKFTISKETTHITKPLTKDGYPDFAGAINLELGTGVNAKNNANVLFWMAHGPHPERATMPPKFFQLMGIESPPEKGNYFMEFGEFLRDKEGIDVGEINKLYDLQSAAQSRPWKSDKYPLVAKWLNANEEPLKLVIEGAKRPKYFSPLVISDKENEPFGLIGVLLPAVQSSRSFARALSARAMLRLAEGKNEAAWQDLLACHRLARHIGQGPTLIEGLVGIAIDGIATQADLVFIHHTRPTAEQVANCVRDLKRLPPLPDMAEKINLCERLMFLDSTLMIARQGNLKMFAALAGEDTTGISKIPDRMLAEIDWDVVLRIGNHWYDRLVAASSKKNRREVMKAMAKLDADLKKLAKAGDNNQLIKKFLTEKSGKITGESIGNIMVALLLPALSAVETAEDRAVQNHHNLRLAFALAAFHSDNGRYPRLLEQLSPKYLKEAPRDIFTGKALVYRPSESGYLLYSFGMNEKDDKGRSFDDDPRGDDLRVRMPLK